MTTEEQTIKLAQFVEYVVCGDHLIHQQFHKLAILWCECTGDMVLCISYHLLPVGFSVNPALHNKVSSSVHLCPCVAQEWTQARLE